MNYRPDYGWRIKQDGAASDVNLNFPGFRLYSLTVLGRGQYSTMVEMSLGGEPHALSLDFNQKQLEEMLSKAHPQITLKIWNELKSDPSSPRTIDFEGEVVFGVKARLGRPQTSQNESFVPLIAQEIINN
jgi:hypothetical protein